jgi:transposase
MRCVPLATLLPRGKKFQNRQIKNKGKIDKFRNDRVVDGMWNVSTNFLKIALKMGVVKLTVQNPPICAETP